MFYLDREVSGPMSPDTGLKGGTDPSPVALSPDRVARSGSAREAGHTATMLLPSETGELAKNVKDALGVTHGMSLVDAIQHEAPFGSWLEAALLAGHVPYFDTAPMFVKACHMEAMREVRACLDRDLPGDAEGAATYLTYGYRELSELLDRLAKEANDAALSIARDLKARRNAERRDARGPANNG